MEPAATREAEEVTIVSREEWGAAPVNKDSILPTDHLQHPCKNIIFSTTQTEECSSREQCSKIIQDIQKDHQEQGLTDILHNFLVASDGTIYEGRGWHIQAVYYGDPTEQDEPYDEMHGSCIDIGYIGKYKEKDGQRPPEVMVKAAMALIKQGIKKQYVIKKFRRSMLDFMG